MSIAVPFFRCENFVETFAEIHLGSRVTPTSVIGFRTESHYTITTIIIFVRTYYLYIYTYICIHLCMIVAREAYVKTHCAETLT